MNRPKIPVNVKLAELIDVEPPCGIHNIVTNGFEIAKIIVCEDCIVLNPWKLDIICNRKKRNQRIQTDIKLGRWHPVPIPPWESWFWAGKLNWIRGRNFPKECSGSCNHSLLFWSSWPLIGLVRRRAVYSPRVTVFRNASVGERWSDTGKPWRQKQLAQKLCLAWRARDWLLCGKSGVFGRPWGKTTYKNQPTY